MTSRKWSETDENTPLRAPRAPATSLHNPSNGSFHFINAFSSPVSSFQTPSASVPTSKSLSFIDGFTPVQKKRKVTRQFTAEDIFNLRDTREEQDQAEERSMIHPSHLEAEEARSIGSSHSLFQRQGQHLCHTIWPLPPLIAIGKAASPASHMLYRI
jgi:hypothetical protein